MASRTNSTADASAFSPALIEVQDEAPHPLSQRVVLTVMLLLALLVLWAVLGKLDVVAIAEGRLIPASHVKIVQPAEQGIVRAILVREGEHVDEGQVLMRMDASISDADRKVMETDLELQSLQLRRIDAELSGRPFARRDGDSVQAFVRVDELRHARAHAYHDQLAAERATLDRARQDLRGAMEIESKLKQTDPIVTAQAKAWEQLAREGFAGKLLAMERERARIEIAQDIKAQAFAVEGLKSTIEQSTKRIAQITSAYRQQLAGERVEVEASRQRIEQELAKQTHRHGLLELRAPQAGIIKDLATHTVGTVVSPGTVLMTVVPKDEPLRAEVMVKNDDIGFIRPDQPVKMKIATFQFQKYGTLDGKVIHVGPDSAEAGPTGVASTANNAADRRSKSAALGYRALVDLKDSAIEYSGERLALGPGMQVVVEVRLGQRTVPEYVLSPVRKAFLEAGRER